MPYQASHHQSENHQGFSPELDHDVRILPKLGKDEGGQDSILLTFDAQAHKPLTDSRFADNLERTFGVKAENRILVPLTWAEGGSLLLPDDPNFDEKTKRMRMMGGYFGVRMSKEGMSSATDEVAAGIAVLIADIYHSDEQLRVLYNHTNGNPAEPIEITGPGYNLAEEVTGEHPSDNLVEIVGHQVSFRHLEAAPNLARAAFA